MDSALKFYFSKITLLKLLLICSFILLIGINCLDSKNSFFVVIGYANILLGLTGISIAIYNILNHKAALVLDQKGISHYKSFRDTIYWDEIDFSEITKIRNQNHLILNTKEILDFDRFKLLFRLTNKTKIESKTILLNINSLNIDYQTLNRFIYNELPTYK